MTNSDIFAVLIFAAVCLDASASARFTLPSGVRVEIIEEKFARDRFHVSGCKSDDDHCRINGHIPFGTQSEVPKTYVKAINISYQGRSYSLDSSDMYDAWGTRPLEFPGVIRYFGGWCYDSGNCEFRGSFSDGIGSFVAEWRVVNARSVRTVLTDSSDIMDLFRKNIDPPQFE